MFAIVWAVNCSELEISDIDKSNGLKAGVRCKEEDFILWLDYID